jgi:hypothetical protein
MRHRAAVLALAGMVCIAPPAAEAWGFELHRFITARAIAQLPAELRPFFEKHADFVVEHSIDPDLWRNAGFAEEPPRHFIDLDAYGTFPFGALPREADRAVEKYGRDVVEKNGTLPWRGTEVFGQLVRAFEQQRTGKSRWALDNVKFHAAVLSHYTADAYVPLHAVLNYDGQLTDQTGLHARFETDLFLRYRDRLVLRPDRVPPVADPRGFLFDALLASFRSADAVLNADRRAATGGRNYDDAYYDRFFEAAGPVLAGRVSKAIDGVAAMIAGAWVRAGRPALPLEARRVPDRRRPTEK